VDHKSTRTKHTKFWLDLKDTLWQSLVEPITPRVQSEEWWGFEGALVEIDFINLCIKKKNYQLGLTLAATPENVCMTHDVQ
jgi:hypothetical protein